jgi:hypothetical protein
MDIGKAFSFVFEDEDWVIKILLGAVILLVPIFGQLALIGYGIAIIRNVKAGESRPLPTWDNWGNYFMDGLMFWVVEMVYAIPIFILICPIIAVGLLPVLSGESEELAIALSSISGIAILGISCLIILYSILLALLRPALRIHYAETGEIGACLRLGDIFRLLFDNLGNIILIQILVWAVSMIVLSVVGTLTLGLLVLPVSFWIAALSSHLYGQIGHSDEALL